MKRSRSNDRLYVLIIKNYIIFMIALLVITLCTYWMWNNHINNMFGTSDAITMMSNKDFIEENYSKLSVEELLGANCNIAVVDSDANLIYSSSSEFIPDYTAEELQLIPEYDGEFVDYIRYYDDDGRPEYIVTSTSGYDENGEQSDVSVMMLDNSFKVVSGSLGDGRKSYTKREFDLLTGQESNDYSVSRENYTNTSGEKRVLLIKNTYMTEENYNEGVDEARTVVYMAVPLYLLVAWVFIYWLNRRIRKPLDRLNESIVSFGEGHYSSAAECGGPNEIQRMGQNFDALAAKLLESEEERKRLDEGRQKLIADISHDLKTPITVIAGYANAINDNKISEENLHKYLEAIDSKARTLTDLINSFYEYSKIEHPDYHIQPLETDICEFFREYLAAKYDEIELANFSLEVSIPSTRVICMLDKLQFSRSLDNLISNSIKYNRLGTVIFAGLKYSSGNVVITVADNGAGIPEDIRQNIFEPFVVGDESRPGGSSGLGLTIAKKIVKEHGGTLQLTDKHKDRFGTEYEITLKGTELQ